MSGHKSRRHHPREGIRLTGHQPFTEEVVNVAGLIDRVAPPGEHFWIMNVLFKISDETLEEIATQPAPAMMLDLENLVSVDGPGCLVCCLKWTPDVAGRPCAGRARVSVRRPI